MYINQVSLYMQVPQTECRFSILIMGLQILDVFLIIIFSSRKTQNRRFIRKKWNHTILFYRPIQVSSPDPFFKVATCTRSVAYPGSQKGRQKRKGKGKKERKTTKINMTNRAPFKQGLQGRKLQGRQIDGVGGGELKAPFFNFAPERQN